MGIKGLAKLLSDEAPDAVREVDLKSLHGRKIAIDASMAIYQFLIAVRSGGANQAAVMLTNADGESTSHIQGMFNRTIRYMTEGIKPVFVFDGKPPNLKSGELLKRKEKREQAEKALQQAKDEGDTEEQDKQSKRLVRAGHKENMDCQRLLELMGVPVVLAPCEAEAQAAAMAKAGTVYATATEDMDALTFQTPVLLRKMTFVTGKQVMVQQMSYERAMEGLGLTHDQFVDLCIVLGCDYCDTIKGVGPVTALKLIKQHGTIEKILPTLMGHKKYVIPLTWLEPSQRKEQGDENDSDNDNDGHHKPESPLKSGDEEDEVEEFVPAYVMARKLFVEHEVLDSVPLKWKPCQAMELKKFLVDEQGFNPERVDGQIKKLQDAYKANQKPQMRMDNFFSVKPSAGGTKKKRKPEPAKKDTKKKKVAKKK